MAKQMSEEKRRWGRRQRCIETFQHASLKYSPAGRGNFGALHLQIPSPACRRAVASEPRGGTPMQ